MHLGNEVFAEGVVVPGHFVSFEVGDWQVSYFKLQHPPTFSSMFGKWHTLIGRCAGRGEADRQVDMDLSLEAVRVQY
jgi:hypothetical protein